MIHPLRRATTPRRSQPRRPQGERGEQSEQGKPRLEQFSISELGTGEPRALAAGSIATTTSSARTAAAPLKSASESFSTLPASTCEARASRTTELLTAASFVAAMARNAPAGRPGCTAVRSRRAISLEPGIRALQRAMAR